MITIDKKEVYGKEIIILNNVLSQEEINKILNGTWQGIDGEDNIYYQDPNIVIKLSLTDGFAYFAEIGDYPVQPKIVLTDLKEIIEEWIEFR